MPELPEVEDARRRLDRWLTGRRITLVHLPDPAAVRGSLSTRPGDALPGGEAALAPLVGEVAAAPLRHGKRLGLAFGRHGLLAHLGMTGKWVIRDAGVVPKFGRLGLEHDGGKVTWFVDSRRFGCVAPCAAADLPDALAAGLGPDALASLPDGPGLAARFRVKRPIKVALLEQDRLAGLGNIHAAEALWRARIHPDRRADQLAPAEWTALSAAIGAQIAWALDDANAEAETTYVSDGAANPFAVYGREGPCPRCGTAVVHEVRAGRTTWWCPTCQPAA